MLLCIRGKLIILKSIFCLQELPDLSPWQAGLQRKLLRGKCAADQVMLSSLKCHFNVIKPVCQELEVMCWVCVCGKIELEERRCAYSAKHSRDSYMIRCCFEFLLPSGSFVELKFKSSAWIYSTGRCFRSLRRRWAQFSSLTTGEHLHVSLMLLCTGSWLKWKEAT